MRRTRAFAAVLVGLGVFILGAGYGYMVHRSHWPPYEFGRELLTAWRTDELQNEVEDPGRFWVGRPASGDGLTTEQQEAIDRLRSIGYVTTAEDAADDLSGGVVWNSPMAQPGLTLYTAADSPAAHLIDLEGNVVHSWQSDLSETFPDTDGPELAGSSGAEYWRHTALLPDGDLLVIHEGIGLARLDAESHVRWSHLNAAHHDVVVGADGRTYVLTRKAHVRPDVHAERPILEDFVTILDDAGNTLDEISILDAVFESDFTSLIEKGRALVAGGEGDIFHTNDVDLLVGLPWDPRPRRPDGGPTHLLFSFRNLDAIVAVDIESRRAVWVNQGMVHRQHDPTLFPDGRLLVFDNRHREVGSRAVEYPTQGGEPVWEYPDAGDSSMFSWCCGLAQRLPNGNTLVTFTLRATALEVTPDGQIAWEFQSPVVHSSGKVAALMQVERILPDGYPFLTAETETSDQ